MSCFATVIVLSSLLIFGEFKLPLCTQFKCDRLWISHLFVKWATELHMKGDSSLDLLRVINTKCPENKQQFETFPHDTHFCLLIPTFISGAWTDPPPGGGSKDRFENVKPLIFSISTWRSDDASFCLDLKGQVNGSQGSNRTFKRGNNASRRKWHN